MRRIIQAVCIVSFLTTPLHAQDFIIGSGSAFHLGGATLELHGDWINEGTFSGDSGTIAFVGQDSSQYIRADHEQAFYSLTVNKNHGDVVLMTDISLDGTLTVKKGSLDLNEYSMDLGVAAEVKENPGNKIKGEGGDISVSGNLNAPQNLNVGGLGAVLSSDQNFGQTTITRGHVPQAGSGNTSILRYYDISTTVKTGLNATLVIHYDDSELNGIPETELQYLRSTDGGLTWVAMGGVVDPVNNTITLTGIDAFSMWSLGTSQAPVVASIESSPLYVDRGRAGFPITEGITITDADDTEIEKAFITVSGNYDRQKDRLIYRTALGITGEWDSTNGTLTLTGTATIADYQEALRNVLFFYAYDYSTSLERIVSFSVNDGTRTGDAISRTVVITAVGDPLLQITSPNGGELTEPGSVVNITWKKEELQTGKLEYSMDGGATWLPIASVDLDDGSYQWTVPEGASESCMVRISSLDQPGYQDISDETFNIQGDCPIVVSDNMSFGKADDTYTLQVSLDTSPAYEDVRVISYLAWGDTSATIDDSYGTLDPDSDGDIDTVSGTIDSIGVGSFMLPADVDSLTVGICAIMVGDAYYEVDCEHSYKLRPDQPTNISAAIGTGDASDSVVLTWDCSPDDGMVTGYSIYRSENDDWSTAELVTTVGQGSTTAIDQSISETIKYYWVQAVSPFLNSESEPFMFDSTVAVSEIVPTEFALTGSYPNPFNPTTTIGYTLPGQERVNLSVYTMTGQVVREYDLGIQQAGRHDFVFDAAGLPSGAYIYRIQAGSAQKTGRMMLMK